MELSILLAEQIIALFLMVILGFLLVKIHLLKVDDSDVLSKLVVFVFSPCVLIQSFTHTHFSISTLSGLLLAIFGAAIVHVIYIALSKLGERFLGLNNIEKASLIYSNAGNLIIPLVSATLGDEWVFYSCAYIIVSTFLFWSHGKSVICEETKIELKKVITNPNILAIILGLIFLFDRISASFDLRQLYSLPRKYDRTRQHACDRNGHRRNGSKAHFYQPACLYGLLRQARSVSAHYDFGLLFFRHLNAARTGFPYFISDFAGGLCTMCGKCNTNCPDLS